MKPSYNRRARSRARPSDTAVECQHLFSVDGGHVVISGRHEGIAEAERLSKMRRGRRLTLVLPVPDTGDVTDLQITAARAARACTRLLIYESAASTENKRTGRAEFLARLVRGAARVECGVVDGTRALRHCIDNIAPGDIIVYCCDVPTRALSTLEEYGAQSVPQIVDRRLVDARTHVSGDRFAMRADRERRAGGL
jgi:tRNA(Ile2) C34 agmatinyltransferase TiaS